MAGFYPMTCRIRAVSRIRLLPIVLLLLGIASDADAHALGITHVTVTFAEGGAYVVDVEAHPTRPGTARVIPNLLGGRDIVVALRSDDAGGGTTGGTIGGEGSSSDDPSEAVTTEHFDLPDEMLVALFSRDRPVRFDGVPAESIVAMTDPSEDGTPIVRLTGRMPEGTAIFRWHAPLELGLSRVRASTDRRSRAMDEWVQPGRPSNPLVFGATAAAPANAPAFVDWVRLGFVHIVPLGLDHILFVLALFLFGASLKPLLFQVTAFTVAHSVTLGLAVAGVARVPSSIVEPLIAASIAVVAFENLRPHPENVVPVHRLAVVFLFGLLHGAGFAAVLEGIGLQVTDRVPAVLGFNAGVELGQLAVLLGAFACVGWARSRPWYRTRIEVPASIGVGIVGLVWTAQRLLA
jgi:hypothetical protein